MGAEKEAEETRRVAEQDFENRCSGKEWRVSMSEMPKAITKAEASGKTPLLLDMTSSHAIDTFYSYQMSQVIEGKKLVMQGRTDTGLAGVMEESRALMVRAMGRGFPLYLRMTNCAADVIGKYNDSRTLPVEVWDREEVQKVLEAGIFEKEGNPFVGAVRPEDCEDGLGMFWVHKEFRAIVCSHFEVDDYEQFLAAALPL